MGLSLRESRTTPEIVCENNNVTTKKQQLLLIQVL
jgi:hypothetical protein